jgi:hypothetical protein
MHLPLATTTKHTPFLTSRIVVREEPGQATNWGDLILGAVLMALKMARQALGRSWRPAARRRALVRWRSLPLR